MDSSEDEALVNIAKKKVKKVKVKTEPTKTSKNAAVAKKRKRAAEPDAAPSSGETTTKKAKGKELKKLDKAERLQYAMQSFLWWDAKEPPEGCQWESMEHAGVSFPDPYVPHGIKMKYDGKEVVLTPAQEEA